VAVAAPDARDLVNPPGLLSLARLPLAMAFPFSIRHPFWAVGVLTLAAVTDVLDGWYARRLHAETIVGAMLDGTMDKVFLLTVVVTLVIARLLSARDAALLCTREIGEIPLAAWVAASGRALQAGDARAASRLGKVSTTLQFLTVALVLLGKPFVRGSVLVTAVCGGLAAAAYWVRQLRGQRPA
jgi:phosphatidylglycerophosphate synthase